MGAFLTGLFLLFLSLQCIQCHPGRIEGRSVCNTLHVSHKSSSRRVNASSNIIVAMLRAGKRVDCIKPQSKYNLTFQVPSSKNAKIKGILVLPVLPENVTIKAIKDQLSSTLLQGVCKSGSISHNCKDSSNGCYLGNDGDSVTIPYMMNNTAISFRYTIVFNGGVYIENEAVHYSLCPTPTEEPEPKTTPPMTTPTSQDKCIPPIWLKSYDTNLAGEPIKYCRNFSVEENAVERSGTCGNNTKYWSNETHRYTNASINYTCHTESLVRKTDCQLTCNGADGKQWCCKNRIYINRPRNFTCNPDPELNNEQVPDDKQIIIYRSKTVLQTKLCVCYLCSDMICPDCDDTENKS